MASCICGNTADGNGSLCIRCAALRVLDLGWDASESQIRTSYLTMVKAWHPDRFQGDRAMKEKAEVKLKDVNSAYEFLTMTLQERAEWQKPAHWTVDTPDARSSSEEESYKAKKTISFASSLRIISRWIVPTIKNLLVLAVLLFVVLIFRYLWIAFDVPVPTGEAAAEVYDQSKDSIMTQLEGPKRRFIVAVEKDLRRIDPALPEFAPPPSAQPEQPAPEAHVQASRKPAIKAVSREPEKPPAPPPTIYSYITVGSTKDEVLAALGPPTASSDDKLVYGKSELSLKDGSVVGWKIDLVSNPIRVKLWPEHPVDTNQGFFTMSSTKDDVLVVQGTPTAFSNDKFEYGGSVVYFQNNRVVRWINDLSTIPLKARTP
jgi:hypothetical protein